VSLRFFFFFLGLSKYKDAFRFVRAVHCLTSFFSFFQLRLGQCSALVFSLYFFAFYTFFFLLAFTFLLFFYPFFYSVSFLSLSLYHFLLPPTHTHTPTSIKRHSGLTHSFLSSYLLSTLYLDEILIIIIVSISFSHFFFILHSLSL